MQQGSDKLPIFATIGAAFRFFWQHRIQFYYLALPAVVVLSVLSTLATLAGPSTAFQFDLFGLHVQSGQELPAGEIGRAHV